MARGSYLSGILMWALLAGSAAAAPANDDFANRTLIPSIPATLSGDTTSSTAEIGDPMSEHSIWWKFTPQTSGSYFLSAYPNYTPYFRLYLYTGNSLNALVKQNGQIVGGAPTYTWREKFELTAGVEYSILIGSDRDWDYGPVTLSVTRNSPPSVSVTSPVVLKPYYNGSEMDLTVDAADPDGNVVRVDYYFYSYDEGVSQPVASSTTPPFSAKVTLSPSGSYYESVLAVATDNDGAKTVSSKVSFLITPYTPHDFFADRKPITGEKVFEAADIQYATWETGEPGGDKSVWWSWTAPVSKEFVFSSRGWPAGFSPRIDVYTGSSLNGLIRVATSDSNGSDSSYTAQATLGAISGQTYAIRLTTIGGQGGETGLSIVPLSPPGTPPQIEDLRVSGDGKIEFMVRTNGAVSPQLQGSRNLKTWSSPGPAYAPNCYLKETFNRPSGLGYFYRIAHSIPAP